MAERFWVFGYGSLMWRPDFPFDQSAPARIHGYHRALCILSQRYRGTPEKPGLVLGLDRGGSCWGVAFRIAKGREDEARQLLIDREMITNAYDPRTLPARLKDGRVVPVWTFIANPTHPQYRKLDVAKAAKLVAQGQGQTGSAVDYLASTIGELEKLGIRDRGLEEIYGKACGRA
ncbi:MAG: gamma-glutamylcyclotransferase [Rhodospirillales bacterium]|nr:gamma-glutamylcyclotransferase [Rhodospirillales bacterium]